MTVPRWFRRQCHTNYNDYTTNENYGKYVDHLNFPLWSWKWPGGSPRVWRLVDGRRKMLDGDIPRFLCRLSPPTTNSGFKSKDSVWYGITMTTANENDGKYVDYLNFPPSSWKRPEGPPRIWRLVDGRRKMPEGEIPRFSIQEVPKDLEDDVVEFMVTYYLNEEVISVDEDWSANLLAVREIRTFWRDAVSQGVGIVALQVNSDATKTPVIAGVNVLKVMTKKDHAILEIMMNSESIKYRTKMMQKLISLLDKLHQESDVLGTYGVDRYLGAFGLTVHPSFRGQGLGEELLRTRNDIGLTYLIPVSETIFTGTASQILAARVGFEVLLERKYSELLDDEGKVAYPSVTVEFIKVMGKRLY